MPTPPHPAGFPGQGRMGRRTDVAGRGDGASAGPTGVPWVNSNGWAIRLAAALHPDTAVWVQAAPAEKPRITPIRTSSPWPTVPRHGGRWVITLDSGLAAGWRRKDAASMAAWKRLCDAAAFFAAHKDWAGYEPQAIVGVISDFAGEHEFFGGELLNLLARAGAALPHPAQGQGIRGVLPGTARGRSTPMPLRPRRHLRSRS